MTNLDGKSLWADLRGRLDDKGFVQTAMQSGVTGVMIRWEDAGSRAFPGRWTLLVHAEGSEDLQKLPHDPSLVVASSNEAFLLKAVAAGRSVAIITDIRDEPTFRATMERLKAWSTHGAKYGIIEQAEETNIPLEQILAMKREITLDVVKVVNDATDAQVTFGVLEHGSDGVLIRNATSLMIEQLDAVIARAREEPLPLTELTVTLVKHIGMGDRACVDLVDLMDTTQGMIIGSTSGGGIFVCSETHFLPYMDLRPFRVNAGGIHSYVWAPDGKTRYLSELRAGSDVLVVDTKGVARRAVVGRVKTERRPLVLIEARGPNGEMVNAIIQDDWHVRVMGAGPEVKNVSRVRPGDKLLGHLCPPGRHVGIAVSETILER